MTQADTSPDWGATLLPLGSTLQQAIRNLDQSGLKIVLVVSGDNELVGTLSDGDIRRAILKGFGLSEPVDKAINTKPLVVPPELSGALVSQLMRANKIQQVPVVDPHGLVVGLHVWDSILSAAVHDNPMVIMAGGQGKRLRPHTEYCPKPMLEVSGKPMLEHIIESAKADGFRNFVISLHYLGHMIEEYFGAGDRHGVAIRYLREESPLGTAGCLSLLDQRPTLPFIVTNGDVLTDVSYSEVLAFHIRHGAVATMAVRQHEIQNQFGVVRTKGLDIEGFEEKPVYRSHINAGIYVLNPDALGFLEYGQHCNMPILFERIKDHAGRTIVYPMHEPWLDVGRPDDLVTAKKMSN
jgi:dTDP-glucose pyrophosphorylase